MYHSLLTMSSIANSTSLKFCGTYIILCSYVLPLIFLLTFDIFTFIGSVWYQLLLRGMIICFIYMLIKDMLFTCNRDIIEKMSLIKGEQLVGGL